jgi:hypothetical protein
MPAHEVDCKRSYRDDEIDAACPIFQLQEVEIRALMLGPPVPHEIEELSIEVDALRETLAEQLRQLPCPGHRELVIEPRRVQEHNLLPGNGALCVDVRSEQGGGERHQHPAPNARSQTRHTHQVKTRSQRSS